MSCSVENCISFCFPQCSIVCLAHGSWGEQFFAEGYLFHDSKSLGGLELDDP